MGYSLWYCHVAIVLWVLAIVVLLQQVVDAGMAMAIAFHCCWGLLLHLFHLLYQNGQVTFGIVRRTVRIMWAGPSSCHAAALVDALSVTLLYLTLFWPWTDLWLRLFCYLGFTCLLLCKQVDRMRRGGGGTTACKHSSRQQWECLAGVVLLAVRLRAACHVQVPECL